MEAAAIIMAIATLDGIGYTSLPAARQTPCTSRFELPAYKWPLLIYSAMAGVPRLAPQCNALGLIAIYAAQGNASHAPNLNKPIIIQCFYPSRRPREVSGNWVVPTFYNRNFAGKNAASSAMAAVEDLLNALHGVCSVSLIMTGDIISPASCRSLTCPCLRRLANL